MSKSESSLKPITFSATNLKVYVSPVVTVIEPNTSPTETVKARDCPS